MHRPKLSKRRQQIYDYLCEYMQAHGYAPSVREICQAVGLSSTSTVASHLNVLEEEGYIKRDAKKPRAMVIPALEERGSSAPAEHDRTVDLPLVGDVAAGVPILAEQNIEETIAVPIGIMGDAGSFILRVKGESMINIGIMDGDYLVVREQSVAGNGEVIVALLDDSATVKTFYKEANRVRLQPENDSMDPIYCENPKILGKVIGLFRSM